jgi:hypothetical protein
MKNGLLNVWINFTPLLYCTFTQTSMRKSKDSGIYFHGPYIYIYIHTQICVCFLKCKNFNICDRYNEIILKMFLKLNVLWYNAAECRQCFYHRHAPEQY